MFFAVIRHDAPERSSEIRRRLRSRHLDFMAGLRHRVYAGGPLLADDGVAPKGGLMLIEGTSRDEVQKLLAADPYESAGLFERTEVYPWRWQTNAPAVLSADRPVKSGEGKDSHTVQENQMVTKERITSSAVREPADKMWSNCLRIGNVVHISGLTSRGDDGNTIDGVGEYEQACIIFNKMKQLVDSAGGVMNDVVKLTIFVTDISKNTEIWRARRAFFTGDFPCCSLVEVSALATPEILVEIEGSAHIGCSGEVAAR